MSADYTCTIRTPQAAVFEGAVLGIRVPTPTGLVGLRPGGEPLVLIVAPGLVVLRTTGGDRFAATAGGLLAHDRGAVVLSTPFAIVGPSEDALLAELDEVFAKPGSDLVARRQIAELEQRIVYELRERPPTPRTTRRHE